MLLVRKLLSLSCLVLLCISCKQGNNSFLNETIIIDYTYNPKIPIVFSMFSDSIIYLPLKGVGDYSGIIGEVKYYKDEYYLTDSNTGTSIFVFDNNGDLKRKIGSKGRGPGEHNSLTDFVIDTINNFVDIYDNARRIINCFDLKTGKLRQSLNTGIIGRDLEILESGKFIIYSDDINVIDNKEIKPGILLLNSDGKFIKNIYELEKEVLKTRVTPLNYFSRNNKNEIYFCDIVSFSINKITDEKITKRLIIKPLLEINESQDMGTTINYGIIQFAVTEGKLYCIISNIKNGQHSFITDLNGNKVFSGPGPIDDISGLINFPSTISSDGNYGFIFGQKIATPGQFEEQRKLVSNTFDLEIKANKNYRFIEVIDQDMVSCVLKISTGTSRIKR
jgi:hypothetical protein